MLLLWKTAKPNRVIELEMNSFYLQICRCGNGLLTGQKASVATEKRVFLLHIVRYAKNNNWVVLIVNIFHIFFFKSARSDLFWIKAEFSIKELSILTRMYRLKCNSICIHHHSKKQQTRQKTRLYSPSWVDWWTTKCCKWSASTELNLICWKIDKNGHVAGTAKDSCQAYHFCNKQPKPAISWCMEI